MSLLSGLVCSNSHGMFAAFQRTTKKTSSRVNVLLKHLLGHTYGCSTGKSKSHVQDFIIEGMEKLINVCINFIYLFMNAFISFVT